MHDDRLKKWEIALICAVAVTALWSCALGRTDCRAWWGTIYPELTPAAPCVQTAAGADGVALRWRLLEWLGAALKALKLA